MIYGVHLIYINSKVHNLQPSKRSLKIQVSRQIKPHFLLYLALLLVSVKNDKEVSHYYKKDDLRAVLPKVVINYKELVIYELDYQLSQPLTEEQTKIRLLFANLGELEL